jgi:hypothetical protein
VDHLLDTLATPAAVVAGTIVTASAVTDMSPFLRWTLAVVAGGGAAGLVQSATVITRGASALTTGGLANPVVSTLELAGAAITSVLAIVVPVLAVGLLAVAIVVFGRKLFRRVRSSPASPAPQPGLS